MIILVVLLFCAVLLGANIYIFIRLTQALPTLPQGIKIAVGIGMGVATCSLFASILLSHTTVSAWLSRLLFQTGSVWLVFLLYMVLALAVMDGLSALGCGIPHRFWVALALCTTTLIAGHWNYKHPRINQVTIEDWRGDSLDNDRPLTIVGISDVHLGEGTGRKALERYVDLINAQHPDVILISGDLIDNSTMPLYLDHMAEGLCRLQAPMGIYMVPGNHEYISGIEDTERFIAQTPITLLRDSIVTLPCGIQIIGRDDRSNRARQPLAALLTNTDKQRPTIVLDHQPYGIAEADSLGIDLLFCGHTHRGQVWPLTWLTDCLFEQSHGYRRWTHAHVYVSQGLSLWGPPFRIGSESELVVFKVTQRKER